MRGMALVSTLDRLFGSAWNLEHLFKRSPVFRRVDHSEIAKIMELEYDYQAAQSCRYRAAVFVL
jgi:hypothetical protein